MDTTTAQPASPPSRGIIFLAGGVIALAALLAYQQSFTVPFFFDDEPAITDNPTIRQLWPLWGVLTPPLHATGAVGRPLVNLSLALNYALGGVSPWGYHAVNLLLHVLCGLTLFGVVLRTLLLPSLCTRFGPAAGGLALVVALLWTLHPLQTETVTCVIQRTELLVGLFYLLTLYAFIRGIDSPVPWRGYGLAIGACLLGMASKEVMVTAPLVVLLYDCTFVAGSFAAARQRRQRFYLALAGTWLLLGLLMMQAGGNRGGVVGFGLGASAWSYALTQCQAVVLYLRLCVWPHPLVLDYGTNLVASPAQVIPEAIVLGLLLAGTIVALCCRPALGFLGAWFFVILAPSSSVVPLTTQTMAEHRMYLPLAAVAVLAGLGLHAVFGRRGIWTGLVVATGLGLLTAARIRDYRSEISIWRDTVEKLPGNARAHSNLGVVLRAASDAAGATVEFETAVRLNRNYAEARQNLGIMWLQAGRVADAIGEFEAASRLKPDYAEAHYMLGNALFQSGRKAEAQAAFEAAVRARAGYADAHFNLGTVLFWSGHYAEAVGQLTQAIAARPDYAEAHFNLGNALFRLGREPEALAEFATALRLRTDYADVPYDHGALLLDAGRDTEAVAAFREALKIRPAYAEAHYYLARALLRLGRREEAVEHLEQALQVRPDYLAARKALTAAQSASPPASR